jgi:hypothetical protein
MDFKILAFTTALSNERLISKIAKIAVRYTALAPPKKKAATRPIIAIIKEK